MQPNEQLHKFLADRAIIVTRGWDGSYSVYVPQLIDEREAMRVAMVVLAAEPERWVEIEDAAIGE